MRITFLVALGLIFSQLGVAQEFTPPEDVQYANFGEKCHMTHLKVDGNIYEYTFSGPDGAAIFDIDAKSGALVNGVKSGIEMRNVAGGNEAHEDGDTKFKSTLIGNYVFYVGHSGKPKHGHDDVIQVIFEKGTGKVVYFFADMRVKWGDHLQNKGHSAKVICSDGTKFPKDQLFTKRDQVLDVLKNADGNPFLSFDQARDQDDRAQSVRAQVLAPPIRRGSAP
jgi:hypothetical protein